MYIAVYNNDVYLQETARVSLQARWSLPGDAPLCASNCSSNGVCTAPATCKCFQGTCLVDVGVWGPCAAIPLAPGLRCRWM